TVSNNKSFFFFFYSAFPVCEKLVGPRAALSPADLNGTWAFIAGSLNHPSSMEALKQRDSITAFFSNNNETSTWSYTQVNRFGDQCEHMPYNITLEGSRFTFDVGNRFSLSGSFLYTTCPDCLVMQWVVESRKRRSMDLYLLSRRRILTQSELIEFKAQLRCFQLPAPIEMDSFKELCPKEPEN
uniref:Apolipoprotein M n=1 Tax=Neogobius melanostomus TaxID=47308 RepID=A0A8C6TCL5_9GOBI